MAEFLSSPLKALCEGVPWIDVRSPQEAGTLPNAVRLPILTDEERHQVGACYAEKGSAAAVDLGHRLVSGVTKVSRVEAWVEHLQRHPTAALYCWRGGMRSQLAQIWLAEIGWTVPRVRGGYKALRQSCMQVLESASDTPMVILSGRTGSGKTDLLAALPHGIDLEGAARHRGSAFGEMSEPQPGPAEFEARLAVAMLRRQGVPYWVLEDEGRMIGRLAVPMGVRQAMVHAPVVVLEVPIEERVIQIYEDYVAAPRRAGQDPQDTLVRLLGCLTRVQRRLGGARFARIEAELRLAFARDPAEHDTWIRSLLEDYYDPMYDYAIEQKASRTIFRGNRREILQFLAEYRPRGPVPKAEGGRVARLSS